MPHVIFASNKSWATIEVFCGLTCIIAIVLLATITCEYALLTTIEKAFGLSATEISGEWNSVYIDSWKIREIP
jgi:hypothetical protein